MRAEARIWRTADGDLVEDGDERAAVLAYAPGDEVAKGDEAAVKKLGVPANKARRAPANKAAAD